MDNIIVIDDSDDNDDKAVVSISLSEARAQIRPILNNRLSTAAEHQRAVWLIQMHPKLASEQYEDAVANCLRQTYTALSYFIHFNYRFGSDKLKTLKLVYKAYPDAIKVANGRDRLPLHEACEIGSSAEIIKFLVESYPEAVSMEDKTKQYPFHLALRARPVSVDSLKVLFERFPDVYNIPDMGGKKPLDRAIGEMYPADVMEFLFSQMDDSVETYTVDATPTMSLVKGLAVLMPQLKTLDCSGDAFSDDALEYFLDCLISNRSITKLTLLLPGAERLLSSPVVQEKLKLLMEQNSTLRSLTVNGSFAAAVSGRTPTNQVSNNFFPLTGNQADTWKVEDLTLWGTAGIIQEWFSGFLQHLRHSAPFLKKLTLSDVYCISPTIDELRTVRERLTDDLVSLLRYRTSLESLVFNNCPLTWRFTRNHASYAVDFVALTKAVHEINSPSLKEYRLPISNTEITVQCQALLLDLLQTQNNTVLQDIQTNEVHNENTDAAEAILQYYAGLNRFGRRIARDPNTTGAEFAKLILDCQEQQQQQHQEEMVEDIAIFNTIFGLLREVPGHWSEYSRGKSFTANKRANDASDNIDTSQRKTMKTKI